MSEEAQKLKKIIRDKLGVDVLDKRRFRGIIDSRLIYAKILRGRGYSLHNIGNLLGKDHSAVVHYSKQFDCLIETDSFFIEKYKLCNNAFMESVKGTSRLDSIIKIIEANTPHGKELEVEKKIAKIFN